MAMVATGPMPGSTPISVPSRQPINAYIRLIGCSATPNPTARWLIRSMSTASTELGPDRELQVQSDDEDTDREHRQQDPADERFPGPELVTGCACRHDEEHGRQCDTQTRHDDSEHHDASEYHDGRPPVEPGDRVALHAQGANCERGTEHDQQDTEEAGKIPRSHPR